MSSYIKRRENNIYKSPRDACEYRAIELKNEMKILLIHDPNSETAAAALNVMIGHMNDPDELPGLAHFCEHMLLMGSKKYPSENEYHKYLSEHAGSCNGTTSTDNTTYYFDINAQYLEQALDRFSQLFINPLFIENTMDREVNAIEGEYTYHLSHEAWRTFYLAKHLAKDGHPFKKFGCGNKQTLQITPKELGINVNKALVKFFKEWYSSNIMTLAVFGKETLDELEKMVAKRFSKIKNKNIQPPKWLDCPFSPELMKYKCLTDLVTFSNSLYLRFPIPSAEFTFKPAEHVYLPNLFGHEGPGSILSLLKSKDWCTSFYAGVCCEARGIYFMKMESELTDEGKHHVDEIIEYIFQYAKMLKELGPQKWFFDEFVQQNTMEFQFLEKDDPLSIVIKKVSHLQKYPFKEILRGYYKNEKWDSMKVEELLNYIQPDNMFIMLVGDHFQRNNALREPWFGVNYHLEEIDPDTLQKWIDPVLCSTLNFPPINEFITNDFDLLPQQEKEHKNPVIIRGTSLMRVWYKQDTEFFVPKMCITCVITAPIGYLDPINHILKFIFVEMLTYTLNEYSYAASLAGINWYINKGKYGMVLWINGYTSKMDIILMKILEKFTSLKIDTNIYQNCRNNINKYLEEFDNIMKPEEKIESYLNFLLMDKEWSQIELLEAMESITEEHLTIFIPYLLSKLHLEILFYGNVNCEVASKLSDMFEEHFLNIISPMPLASYNFLPSRVIQMNPGANFIYEMEENVSKNSCITIYYQCGEQTHRSIVLLELLNQLIKEPFYNTLRTKEQLGYYVWSGIESGNGAQGLQFTILSDKSPYYLNKRIEAFLETMDEFFNNLKNEEFQIIVDSLRLLKLERSTSLTSQNCEYWREITTRLYDFNRTNSEIEELNKITKMDVITFFKENIKIFAPKRSKLSIYLIKKDNKNDEIELDEVILEKSDLFIPLIEEQLPQKINNIRDFKNSQSLYPLPTYEILKSHFNLVSKDKKEE